jgi:N-acetylmuramoyl-L-alanine amidase
VGHWVAPSLPDCGCAAYDLDDEGAEIAEAQALLRGYGYEVETHGRFDERTRIVVRAFQQHFRQACADGRLDAATLDTLRRLAAALPVCAVS